MVITRIITTALVALVVSGPALAEEFSHKKCCADFKYLSEEANTEGPSWVDSYTRFDGTGVICFAKLVVLKKIIKVFPDRFRAGWKGNKQTNKHTEMPYTANCLL